MAVPEQNYGNLKEVFSKSKKEFEEDIRRDTLDFWPGMEVFLDPDDMAFTGDWTASRSEEAATIKPLQKSTTLKPLEKDPTKRSLETGPTMNPFERWYTKRPLEKEATPKLFDKKPAFRTPEIWHPFDNLHPSKPSVKWPPTAPALLHPIKPINDWDLPQYNYKFVFEHPTPPPVTSAAHTAAVVMKVIGGAVGFFFALLVLSILLDKKNRPRRGVVLAAGAADLEMLTASTPFDAGAPETFKSDLPPPYYECAPYSTYNCVGEMPPPYTYPEDGASQDHKPQQDAFIENELKAYSEDGAPDMRTELVFDNGRVVERLSLDLNRNNNETGAASNDNVEEQSNKQGDIKDRVYVDETGHVKGNTQ